MTISAFYTGRHAAYLEEIRESLLEQAKEDSADRRLGEVVKG